MTLKDKKGRVVGISRRDVRKKYVGRCQHRRPVTVRNIFNVTGKSYGTV